VAELHCDGLDPCTKLYKHARVATDADIAVSDESTRGISDPMSAHSPTAANRTTRLQASSSSFPKRSSPQIRCPKMRVRLLRQQSMTVMEGGERAFRLRMEGYGF